MDSIWQFYKQKATDPIHNPIAGEFFSTEAVGDVTDSLIREGLQNTLDARRRLEPNRRQPAHVRIYLSGEEGALRSELADSWFGSLRAHIDAPGNGLRDLPQSGEPCPFLAFEDFGTTGLIGDPEAFVATPGQVNHFLAFFRAEGYSDKGGHDRGSWGVGKTVFPRASRIGSIFGLTVRADDTTRLLLGRSILKYHSVNGESFKSDGYWGTAREADGLVLPESDATLLDRFCKDFSLQRGMSPGLSIVVPWYEIDRDGGVTRDRVIMAVLSGFFFSILLGHLSVTVTTPQGEIQLKSDTIHSAIESLGAPGSAELAELVALAEWARTRSPNDFISLALPPSTKAQAWLPEAVSTEGVSEIRRALASGERVAIRVPMTVHPKVEAPSETHFGVFLCPIGDKWSKPVFVRDELIISDVKSPRVSGIRALVVVEDAPLATLLRAAETPAHTQWNQDTGNFKNRYKFGPGAIKFVRTSVSEVMNIVSQAEHAPDPTITLNYFSIEAPKEPEGVKASAKKSTLAPGEKPPPPPEIPPATGAQFRIHTLAGGFRVRGRIVADGPRQSIRVRLAYDVRNGSALAKFRKEDFDVAQMIGAGRSSSTGTAIEVLGKNELLLLPEAPEFDFSLTGFDENRDLFLKATASEVKGAD